MQYTFVIATLLAIVGLFAQLTFALPAPAPAAVAVAVAAAAANPEVPTLAKRGFGCNGPWDENDLECHRHCDSIEGYRGGYCDNFGFRCFCYT